MSHELGTTVRPRPLFSGLLHFVTDFHNRTILFRVGDVIFVTYGVLAALAFMTGFLAAVWYDAMAGFDPVRTAALYLFFVVPSVLLGCRLFSILLEWRELFKRPLQTLVKPGYMLHGGVLGAVVSLMVVGSITGAGPLHMLDTGGFAAPLGEAICRLGCFVYGCCWGRPTHGPIGVRYTSEHAKVVRCAPHLHGVKLHPAQIYGLVAHLLQFTLLYALLPYKAFDGMFAAVYLVTHPLIRFSLEYFREDDRGRLWGGFTHTNLYSAVMIVAGVGLWVYASGQGVHHPADMSVRWIHVLLKGSVMAWIGLIGLVCMLAYGVHYKRVGSWISQPSAGLSPEVTELSAGAALRLRRALRGEDPSADDRT